MHRTLSRITATIVALGASSLASADLINIESDSSESTEGLGLFTGTINYVYSGAGNTGSVTISLTNTSPLANGGFITAFVFNLDSADVGAAIAFSSSTDGDFGGLSGGGLNAPPFGGPYDAGASTSSSWTGGGSPSVGIGILQSASFVFNVTASDAATLTATDFINGPFEHDFVVRYRGFEDGGSDKVPGVVTVVPAPGALALLGLGGLIGSRRRRAA